MLHASIGFAGSGCADAPTLALTRRRESAIEKHFWELNSERLEY